MKFVAFAFLLLFGTAAQAAVDPFVLVANGRVVEKGIASWYGYDTGAPACGLPMGPRTAAHKTLPCGTYVKVTRDSSGRSIVVRIVDRGPFVAGRIIDLSPSAARELGISGLAAVTVEVVK